MRVPDLPLELPHRDNDLPGGAPQLDIDKGCLNDPPDPAKARKTRDAAPNTVNVAIAAYTPKLDAPRGDEWYCDLPITTGDAYFPFIWLKQFPAYLNRWDSQQARNEGVSGH
jgi:hypothetical protein